MSNDDRFSYLLSLYLSGNISTQEHEEFIELVSTNKYDALISQSVLQDLKNGFDNTSADLPPHIAQEIVRNIYNADKHTVKVLPVQPKNRHRWYWVAAASLIIIAISSYFLFIGSGKQTKEDFASIIPPNTIINKNTTGKEQVVLLSDGSSISLQPNSTIHYLKNFNNSIREVYLEGEGFFQVAKNPKKPFLVYYNNIVTKVLGTSFIINTNPKTGNVEVAVKTGRVQVFENAKIVKGNIALSSVIVTPNQKVIYQPGKRQMETSLVNIPDIIHVSGNAVMDKVNNSFVYEQEKLSTIFNELENSYGIEIVVENANLNDCVFTGDVSSQDLFTKLKIICLTTNSSYEVNGTKILIKGKGCN